MTLKVTHPTLVWLLDIQGGRALSPWHSDFTSLENKVSVLDRKLDSQFDKFTGQVDKVKDQVDRVTTLLDGFITEMRRLVIKGIQPPRSPSPTIKKANSPCFKCGELGHFRRECPKGEARSPDRKVTFAEETVRPTPPVVSAQRSSLSWKGASHEAGVRPL